MSKAKSSESKAREFLNIASEFHLGDLPTEGFHPKTQNLSELANENLKKAIAVLKRIDLEALEQVRPKLPEVENLSLDIARTLRDRRKVFLCGCGSTGRLSLSLEVFWRHLVKDPHYSESFVSFMAGGDTALIKAIENFEDHPEYAKSQLKELGFAKGDLLIGCSEGGETPFVIGAVETALKLSDRSPYFLYCNPDKVLMKNVERSRNVLANQLIKKINLNVGPMALSGSTRMQASTVLMFVLGLAMLRFIKKMDFTREHAKLVSFLNNLDFNFLKDLIVDESLIYQSGGFLLYETDRFGITLLTDTTERAPTFSLIPFENRFDENIKPSLSYLSLIGSKSIESAWRKLLLREPRVLDLKKYPQTSQDYIYGFDFSSQARSFREKNLIDSKLYSFKVREKSNHIVFSLRGFKHAVSVKNLFGFYKHLVLKILLNIHSTLVMGRLGRYESNVMTWVQPSNNKLIDRSIRYIRQILEEDSSGIYTYDQIAYKLFEEMEKAYEDESVVMRVVKGLRGKVLGSENIWDL